MGPLFELTRTPPDSEFHDTELVEMYQVDASSLQGQFENACRQFGPLSAEADAARQQVQQCYDEAYGMQSAQTEQVS